MEGITVTTRIQAPVEKVFQIATDLRGAPGRMHRFLKLEVLTDGPVGAGTRFRETRRLFNREASEEMEIVEFEPPRRCVVRAESHGCRFRTEFLFTPEGDATALVMKFEAEPITMTARVM